MVRRESDVRQLLTIGAALLLAAGLGSLAAQTAPTAPPTSSPRERLSINDGWRFTKDDPPGRVSIFSMTCGRQ